MFTLGKLKGWKGKRTQFQEKGIFGCFLIFSREKIRAPIPFISEPTSADRPIHTVGHMQIQTDTLRSRPHLRTLTHMCVIGSLA